MANNFIIGFIIELIGTLGILIYPIIFLYSGKKRYALLTIISLLMALFGYMFTII